MSGCGHVVRFAQDFFLNLENRQLRKDCTGLQQKSKQAWNSDARATCSSRLCEVHWHIPWQFALHAAKLFLFRTFQNVLCPVKTTEKKIILFLPVSCPFATDYSTFYTKDCGKTKKKEESVRIINVMSIQIYNREMLYVHTHKYIYTHRDTHAHIQNNT